MDECMDFEAGGSTQQPLNTQQQYNAPSTSGVDEGRKML
jgi:hypothetical protein